MSKARPAYNSHKLRYVEWGAEDKTLKETESGAVVLINADTGGSDYTCTLPAAKKGLYFKFVWTILNSTDDYRAIKTASTSELIKGTVIVVPRNASGDANARATQMVINQLDGTSNDEIRMIDDVDAGSWIELVCDGDHWYTADSLLCSVDLVNVASTIVDEQ